MQLSSIEEIIEDFRNGKMVVIMDDEDRENEGDLVMAAEKVRAEDVNFMARYARGLICLTLTRERCRQLRLPLMVDGMDTISSTNFTLSIEAAEGVTTGISAADRAVTIQKAVAENAIPDDIVQPGHVFPLMAQPGGVLNRAGHTEAGCDLSRLAGLDPSAAIVEILNDDGSMARRPDLEKFASEHDLKIGTIEDLIRYRIENEKTVERVSECDVDTEFGSFRLYAYQDTLDMGLHLAMVKGEIKADVPVTVRVQIENTLTDALGTSRDYGWPLRDAIQQLSGVDVAVLVYLRPVNESRKIIQWMAQSKSGDEETEAPRDLRTDGVGSQILVDLGVRKMLLMTAPKVIYGLGGFGLEIVDYVTGDNA